MESQKLIRHEGWETRYSTMLIERSTAPFAWGKHDCALFPSDGILIITGIDPAAEYRGKYTDEASAQAIVDAAGGMEALFTQCLGITPHNDYRKAKRGEMVLMNLDGKITGGIVDDTGSRIAAVGLDRMGLIRFPLRSAMTIWGY